MTIHPDEKPRPPSGLSLNNAPIGTRAPAVDGGYWERTEHGWKWCTGDTFPRPGGDWNGKLLHAPGAADCLDAEER